MRHQSQSALIDNLKSLIATIEALPEEAEVTCVIATGRYHQLELREKMFREMFAGKEIKINYVLHQFELMQDGTEYVCRAYDSIEKLTRVPQKTLLLPEVEVIGGAQ